MELNDAKTLMTNEYQKVGLTIEDAGQSLIVLKGEQKLQVCEEDLLTYATQYGDFADLVNLPNECSICSINYREQVISPASTAYFPFFRPASRLLTETTFGEQAHGIYAQISPASMLFKNRLRFEQPYLEICLRRISSPALIDIELGIENADKEQEALDIRSFLHDPVTIKIFNLNSTSIEQSIAESTSIIEACIFELSYLKGLPIEIQDGWARQRARIKPFRFPENIPGNNLPFPKGSYQPEILRFYLRGASSRDPVIQFLSFYQVLEYFFVTVSDRLLYEKLMQRLLDPGFKYKPRSLDLLITDVLEHRRITDETEMLKLVLEQYVSFDILAEFIQAYETYIGEKFYTKRSELFGKPVPDAKIQEGHLHGNIASRIKIIRNAVVHSSDRYERQDRFIPLTKQSEGIIEKEIPLLQFLAERVIIATSTPRE